LLVARRQIGEGPDRHESDKEIGMRSLMVRYQVANEGVADIVGAIEAAFAAVEAQQPAGVRWAYYRRADSTEFVALLELDDGVENPLLGIGPARELRSAVARWVAGDAPTPLPLDLLGSYGFVR
jgi:hypothetical protein